MRKISPVEGRSLIAAGEAGWYTLHANPPILHDRQIVVVTNNSWFLLTVPDEIEVKEAGVTEINGVPKMAYAVSVTEEEVGRHLISEAEAMQQIGKRGDVPMIYAGKGDSELGRN